MALKYAPWLALGLLAGCSPDLSPNTYNAAAVQQANKVEQGVVVGVRGVDVKVSGNTGAVAGAAAGGIVGSTVPGSSTSSALGAVGGSLIGGLIGSSVERATGDTRAYEYIVRKPNGELISVTQTDEVPLALGQNVLVIAGSQARIVPDYTTKLPEPPKPAPAKPAPAKDAPAMDVPATDAPAKDAPASDAPAQPAPTSLAPPKDATLTGSTASDTTVRDIVIKDLPAKDTALKNLLNATPPGTVMPDTTIP